MNNQHEHEMGHAAYALAASTIALKRLSSQGLLDEEVTKREQEILRNRAVELVEKFGPEILTKVTEGLQNAYEKPEHHTILFPNPEVF